MRSTPTAPVSDSDLGSRINARLGPSHRAKLEVLRRATGESVTSLVKQGIDLLFEREQQRSRGSALEILREAGFIAAAEGPNDLSERYKDLMPDLLNAKHGHR